MLGMPLATRKVLAKLLGTDNVTGGVTPHKTKGGLQEASFQKVTTLRSTNQAMCPTRRPLRHHACTCTEPIVCATEPVLLEV